MFHGCVSTSSVNLDLGWYGPTLIAASDFVPPSVCAARCWHQPPRRQLRVLSGLETKQGLMQGDRGREHVAVGQEQYRTWHTTEL